MGDKISLTVSERRVLGKKVKQLRKAGVVPAVMYGHDVPAVPVEAPAVDALKVWKSAGKHHVVELTLSGKKRLAMIKSADIEPVKHKLRHLSLHVVKQNEKVETEVPVKVTGEGETPAEKAGLVILQAIENVPIAALPANLPNFLEVPGERLMTAGDHLTVHDIIPAAGVEILAEPEQIVVTVYEPGALAAANDAAAGDATDETAVEAEHGSEPAGEGAPEAAGPEDKAKPVTPQ